MRKITFVDMFDNVIGHGSKQEAIDRGLFHRISRIFLFNSEGRILMQRRSNALPSLPGRWDVSAAGHVEQDETYLDAAHRELCEEIGLKLTTLEHVCKFISREFDEILPKYRFNTVFWAPHDGPINPNLNEVEEVRWVYPPDLVNEIVLRSDTFTAGCIEAIRNVIVQPFDAY